jgi:RNA polymerase sigma-70 factor (ECF subfamily)
MTDTSAPGRLEPGSLDPESREWLDGLRSGGAAREEHVARLHRTLLRIARAEVSRRAPKLNVYGPELDDIAAQAAADALLTVTAKLGDFRGDSRFTTWAYKFVMFEVSSKMSRHFWNKASVRLDAEDWERLPARLGMGPEAHAEARELTNAVRRAIMDVLTPNQRRVFVALVVDGMPLDALVAELGSSRNAVYKTMFDARRKLRAWLVTNGYLAEVGPRSGAEAGAGS